MLTEPPNHGGFSFCSGKKFPMVQFFLGCHLSPDCSLHTIIISQKTYGESKQGMLYLCRNLGRGGLQGHSPWIEYTMNHRNSECHQSVNAGQS